MSDDARLAEKIARLEAERAEVARKMAGHYSRTVRKGAAERVDDIDTLLAMYRAELGD